MDQTTFCRTSLASGINVAAWESFVELKSVPLAKRIISVRLTRRSLVLADSFGCKVESELTRKAVTIAENKPT
jgi:hypothetical protein